MRFTKSIDRISEWTGSFAAWLIIPLMLVIVNEVFMRYVLNAPTGWGYDTSWMIFAAQWMIGGAFTQLRKGHIRIDIVYTGLSEKTKQIYDLVILLVVILPPLVLLTWAGIFFAADAWVTGEKLSTTNWFFPAGPIKSIIPIGFFLISLQCLAEIIRSFRALRERSDK